MFITRVQYSVVLSSFSIQFEFIQMQEYRSYVTLNTEPDISPTNSCSYDGQSSVALDSADSPHSRRLHTMGDWTAVDFGADEPRAHSPSVGARSSLSVPSFRAAPISLDDEARRQQMIRERAIEVKTLTRTCAHARTSALRARTEPTSHMPLTFA